MVESPHYGEFQTTCSKNNTSLLYPPMWYLHHLVHLKSYKLVQKNIKHTHPWLFHHFSVRLCWRNLPEMAAATAALKLGSFVNEEAICSTKNC